MMIPKHVQEHVTLIMSNVNIYGFRSKKILKCSLVLQTSTPVYLLVLLPNITGHSRNKTLHYIFLLVHRTLDENICLFLIEILLVP